METFYSFRPLAGIMVLIYASNSSMSKQTIQFPSPCGDYGSYRSLKT